MLALLLLLVPAPPAAPPHPIVGEGVMFWGHIQQECRWDADGTYVCPVFRGTTWAEGDDGTIWFFEQHGAALYGMQIDWRVGEGRGWRQDENGQGPDVRVKIVRRERLPTPKGIE